MRQRLRLVVLLLVAFLAGWLGHSLLGMGAAPSPDREGPSPTSTGHGDARLREEAARLRARVSELESPLRSGAGGPEGVHSAPSGPDATDSTRAAPPGDPANGTLRVRVREFSGKAVPGISIRVLRGRPDPTARDAGTEADGVAEFAGLAPGEWHLEVSFPEGKQASNVSVHAGHVSEVSMVHPARGVPFEGTVRDATGGPMEGVTVTLTSMEGGFYATLGTKTDAAGAYRFEGVRPGGWNVSLSSNAGESGFGQANHLFVPSGGTFRKDFLAGPLLRGILRDRSTGAPIAGAQVQGQQRGQYLTSVTTDAEGAFGFKGLTPGTFELLLSRSGYGFTIVRNVEVPEEGATVDLEMSPAARLRLHVTDAEGRAVTGDIFIGISPKTEGQGTSVGTSFQADADGRASYDQILPGAYLLHFKAEKVGETRVEATLTPGENSIEVQLEAGK